MSPAEAAIRPCPFCGSAPHGPTKEGGGDERMGYNFLARITCACGATIARPSHKGVGGWCDDTGQAKAEVAAAWNSRSELDALRARCEAAEALLRELCESLKFHQEQTRPIHGTTIAIGRIDAHLKGAGRE